MIDNIEKLRVLKIVFMATNNAMYLSEAISNLFPSVNKNVNYGKFKAMQELHKECLEEINKDNLADLKRIDSLMIQMEVLASQPINPGFQKGCIASNDHLFGSNL